MAFTNSYLSEAFPNPQRIDCPPHSDRTRIAENLRDADLEEHEIEVEGRRLKRNVIGTNMMNSIEKNKVFVTALLFP